MKGDTRSLAYSSHKDYVRGFLSCNIGLYEGY